MPQSRIRSVGVVGWLSVGGEWVGGRDPLCPLVSRAAPPHHRAARQQTHPAAPSPAQARRGVECIGLIPEERWKHVRAEALPCRRGRSSRWLPARLLAAALPRLVQLGAPPAPLHATLCPRFFPPTGRPPLRHAHGGQPPAQGAHGCAGSRLRTAAGGAGAFKPSSLCAFAGMPRSGHTSTGTDPCPPALPSLPPKGTLPIPSLEIRAMQAQGQDPIRLGTDWPRGECSWGRRAHASMLRACCHPVARPRRHRPPAPPAHPTSLPLPSALGCRHPQCGTPQPAGGNA